MENEKVVVWLEEQGKGREKRKKQKLVGLTQKFSPSHPLKIMERKGASMVREKSEKNTEKMFSSVMPAIRSG